MKIGVFDSGIGGFSILTEIIKRVGGIEIYYISDDAFAPYGEKKDSEIIERSIAITDLFLQVGVQLVVVACNTATAVAIGALREKYPEVSFVGVEPYINVLNHKDLFPNIKNVAVITTELTGNSKKFQGLKNRIDPEGKIAHVKMPNLATIVEEIVAFGITDGIMKRLKSELSPLKKMNLDHLILGCTHYPLIAKLIECELNLSTICPGPYVANRVYNLLKSESVEYAITFNFLSTKIMVWREYLVADLAILKK